MHPERKKYLFVRLLEACNANCFMCDFALSRDPFRLSQAKFEGLLEQARLWNVGFVRFTGGEPLMHRRIADFVRCTAKSGMGSSIITNAALLAKKARLLAESGLDQVVVSIDGVGDGHDRIRGTSGLYRDCMAGLAAAREAGLMIRVNTVVGPHNYREMPTLQSVLTVAGVVQWELSALKLERPICYENPDDLIKVCAPLYRPDNLGTLVPMGPPFYGDTEEERERFFRFGVPPRAQAPRCNLIGDVIYIDPKSQRAFGCSLLPHRSAGGEHNGVALAYTGGDGAEQSSGAEICSMDPDRWSAHVAYFRENGPGMCHGCSTTAVGYSNRVARGEALPEWVF